MPQSFFNKVAGREIGEVFKNTFITKHLREINVLKIAVLNFKKKITRNTYNGVLFSSRVFYLRIYQDFSKQSFFNPIDHVQ